MHLASMCRRSRARAIALPWVCPALAVAAVFLGGCATVLTDGKDFVVIRKSGDTTVIKASEGGTGETATIVCRADGTVSIKAKSKDGEV